MKHKCGECEAQIHKHKLFQAEIMAGMHLAIIAIVLVLYAATTQQLSVRRTWKDDSLQEMLMNHLQVESNEGIQFSMHR